MIAVSLTIVCMALALLGAIAVVRDQNLVHSVFWLAVVLLSTAGLFLSLHATFLAAIQMLLYTGGVITLMLFGVMLSHRAKGALIPNPAKGHLRAAFVCVLTLFTLVLAIWREPALGTLEPIPMNGAQRIGEIFLTQQLLAFEVLSVLLLAAMIGAIVLARAKDP